MSIAVTLVHAPGAMPESAWRTLHSHAPGSTAHECRLVVDSAEAQTTSGARIEPALRRFIAGAADAGELVLSTAGFKLAGVAAGSPLIHPGMVVLLSPRRLPLSPVRHTPLSLSVDSGPDAGRLIPLRRGSYVIGRARVDVPLADPQLSRREAVLEVGSHHVELMPSGQASGTEVTTAGPFDLGSTRCRLVLGEPGASPPQQWPPPEAPVEGKPPEGRHAMMLAFALVPLVAGLVLVLVTGLWFFLLFSAASAVIASSIFVHGQRQRRRYRRARREAAAAWAEQAAEALASPGRAAQLLRGEGEVCISAAAEDHPAVRLGTGRMEAQLESTCGAKEQPPESVTTAAGITLAPGEITGVTGAHRERLRLQRWILLQLVLNPLRCDLALLTGSGLWVTELRDVSQCRVIAGEDVSSLNSPSGICGVLLSADPLDSATVTHAVQVGWHVVAPYDAERSPPQVPGWDVDLSDGTVHRRLATDGAAQNVEELRIDGLGETTLRELSRLAVPHASSTVGPAQLPIHASRQLLAELFTESAAAELLAELGPSLSGAEQLDLVGDGPHVLIAGTTGSGKSELLKTVLLSLCARYSPHELSMVLVDFKGGATFQRMAGLEHTLGVVTDLSQAAAERTLESIRSELVRRERLFLEADAGDYIEYRSRTSEPLPRMLVVIDEFRIFAHELPGQLDELMRLATLGRSLGLHLVLSTQRPQGAVTADIRANIGAAVALRMRGEDESRDVIGTAAAAAIPRAMPGRALLRRPGEAPVELQTALLQTAEPPLSARPEVSESQTPASQQADDVVSTLIDQLHRRRLHRPHTPLLPPLPERLQPHDALKESPGALLGRIDDPSGQAQYDLRLDAQTAQAFALIGEASAAAGLTCAAVAAQLLSGTQDAGLYLLDGDRSLPHLDGHPQVGAWLTEEHLPEALHLLDELCEELTARRMGRGTSQQPLVVVLTGYSRWLTQSQTGLGLEHQLGMLASEGPPVGISVLLAGGRELAVGKLVGRFTQRIYLPFGSGEDVTYLWPKLRSTAALPGRGVLISSTVASPGLTVQLTTEDHPGSCPPASAADAAAQGPSIRVRSLPERLPSAQLPQIELPGVLVGVQQLTWAPVALQLGPVNLILGSPGTGKTSCLRLLQHQLPHAQLMRPGAAAAPEAAEVLLIDDAHRCTAGDHQAIQEAIGAGVQVVATAPASAAVFQQLPWAHPARTQGSNVILSPLSRSEAEAFTVIIPTLDRPIPGRAVHLRPEGAVIAQWALPPQ